MLKDIDNGIFIVGNGSFSIDQQRYNAQFGGQLFYEIKGGKITRMLEDVAYQMRTPEFWNSGVRIRSEEHTSELQSLMRISYAVFCLKKKKNTTTNNTHQ